MELIEAPVSKKPAGKIDELVLKAEAPIVGSQPLESADVEPSPTNEGRAVEDADFLELCASVQLHGVLQPILVRPKWCVGWDGNPDTEPIDKGKPGYEIVAGERRWRAATKAGQPKIPAVVRTMGDAQALEIQAIENAQRKNLSEVQEARAFQRLMAVHGYSIEKMVERVGKSRSHVYGRMKLLEAPGFFLDAVEKGEASASVATLVGRVPNRELREKAAQEILNARELNDWRYRTKDGEAMSFRQAKSFIEERYMVELKGAPFDVKADGLIEGLGPCAKCPKRAGNLPDFDPKAGRADVCTDPLCFQAKKEAAIAKAAAKLEEQGKRLLTEKESEDVFNSHHGDVDHGSPYAKASAQPEDYEVKDGVKKKPSWKSLAATAGVETVMAISPSGRPVELVKKAAVIEALKSSKDNIFSRHAGRGGADEKAQMKAAREKAKLEQGAAFSGLNALWEKRLTHRFFGTPGFQEVMLETCLDHAHNDGRWLLCKWLGLTVEKSSYGTPDHEKALTKFFQTLTMPQEQEALLVLLLIARGMKWSSVEDEDFGRIARFFQLEPKRFMELAKESRPAPPPPTPANFVPEKPKPSPKSKTKTVKQGTLFKVAAKKLVAKGKSLAKPTAKAKKKGGKK